MAKRHEAERTDLLTRLKAERSQSFAGDWKGKGLARNALASVIAAQQAAEKMALRERQAEERKALQEEYRPLPPYREWKCQPAITSSTSLENSSEIRIRIAEDQVKRLSTMLRQLQYEQDRRGYLVYQSQGREILRDEGRRLAVLDPKSDELIAIALAIAQQKFGRTLTLTGDDAFQRRVVAVAVAQKLPVKFADPQLEAMRLELVAGHGRRRTHGSDRAVPHETLRERRKGQRDTMAPAEKPTAPVVLETLPAVPARPSIEEWLAVNPAWRTRAPAEGVGPVVYVAPDGRWLQKIGRDKVLVVRPPAPSALEVGAVVAVDKIGQIRGAGKALEKGR